MKKFSFFSVMVALTFMFSACNKSVSDQINDEGTAVGVKTTFVWAKNPAQPVLYSYGKVDASVFAHFTSGGTQFNNEWMYPVPGSEVNGKATMYLFRDKNDKGNGWVKIVFLPNAKDLAGEDCDYNIGVRFKGSLNAVWTFTINTCVDYCADLDNLQPKEDAIVIGEVPYVGILIDGQSMGPVTQIRFGGADAFYCDKPYTREFTVNVFKKGTECDEYESLVPEYSQEVTVTFNADGTIKDGGLILWQIWGEGRWTEFHTNLYGFSETDYDKCLELVGWGDVCTPDVVIICHGCTDYIVTENMNLVPVVRPIQGCRIPYDGPGPICVNYYESDGITPISLDSECSEPTWDPDKEEWVEPAPKEIEGYTTGNCELFLYWLDMDDNTKNYQPGDFTNLTLNLKAVTQRDPACDPKVTFTKSTGLACGGEGNGSEDFTFDTQNVKNIIAAIPSGDRVLSGVVYAKAPNTANFRVTWVDGDGVTGDRNHCRNITLIEEKIGDVWTVLWSK